MSGLQSVGHVQSESISITTGHSCNALLSFLHSLRPSSCSQSAAVDDLVVNDKLPSTIIDDLCPDASPTISERPLNLAVQVSLVDNRESLLDVASLGHANEAAVFAHVEDAVLLKDGAEHALHDDRRLRVADEARLLLKLAREEVDAEVSVLACLWGHRDADDLARSAL